jgi:C4-dicarboxylate transporter
VLLGSEKAESSGLKTFGKVVTVLLWAIAVMVIICGIYMGISGKCPAMGMMPMMGRPPTP